MKRDAFTGLPTVVPRHPFTAPVDRWQVTLSLPRQDTRTGIGLGRVTLDAALSLRRAEPALADLEDWLGAGLLPTPAPHNRARPTTDDVWLVHEPTDTRVQLPWALLLQAGPPTEAMALWRWADLPCALVLDQLPLSAADRQALEPGALALLPASFEPAWPVRLVPRGGAGVGFLAHLVAQGTGLGWLATGQHMPAAPAEGMPAQAQAPVKVLAATALAVNALALLRPPVPGAAPRGWGANAVVLAQAAGLRGHRRLAAGRLLPVASGHGVHLTRARAPGPSALEGLPWT